MKKLPNVTRAGFAAVGLATSGALVLAGCGASNEEPAAPAPGGATTAELSGTLVGAGASSQAAAQEAWRAGFIGTYPDVTVNYDPVGSGGGRTQFIAGETAFAGNDAYFDEEELPMAQERCGGEIVEVPLYISPIAVVYNLEGVDMLNLSPEVLAGIFSQQITSWDDPAIAELNPDATLPATPITPVNRSDESGTTENFAEYLAATAPDVWTYEVSGDWPVPGGEAAQGTSGVIGAVDAGDGTIGYADASQAGDLGVASIQVGESFEQPTPEAAAAVVEASTRIEGRGEYSFAYDLARDTAEAGTYPIVLISYIEACTMYDDAETAELTQAYLTYLASEEGQTAAAEAAGSAPISDTLREMVTPAIEAIAGP